MSYSMIPSGEFRAVSKDAIPPIDNDQNPEFQGGVPGDAINRAEQYDQDAKDNFLKKVPDLKPEIGMPLDNDQGAVPAVKIKQAEEDWDLSDVDDNLPVDIPLPLDQNDDHIFSNVSAIDLHEVFQKIDYDNNDGGVQKQGQNIEYDQSTVSQPDNKLYVYVVPHSHCDPGWIMTYKDYYDKKTRNIINTIINSLQKDPKRRFIWAEVSFFKLWQDEQEINGEKRKIARELVSNGQLEFVTGGYVMNDEANTNIYAMLSQLLEGLEQLKEIFNITPIHGQSIDPFGHSPTMSYVLKQLGFQSSIINRVHYKIKKYLAKSKNLEFYWRQSQSDEQNDLLTHIMPFYSYDIPHTCGPDPAVCCTFDFARVSKSEYSCPSHQHVSPTFIDKNNLNYKSKELVNQYRKKAELYRTNAIIVPLGDDFRYQSEDEAENQFNNYQMIFDAANNDKDLNVHLQFGTPNDYFGHIKKFSNDFPVLTGSFFTYSDIDYDYWSGYYTSRMFQKNQDRILEQSLFATEISMVLAREANKSMIYSTHQTDFRRAQQNLGLFQHHDGITGTANDHVMIDYAKRLYGAIYDSKRIMGDMLSSLLVNRNAKSDENSELNQKISLDSQYDQESHLSLPNQKIMESDYSLIIFNPRSQVIRQVITQRVRINNVCVSTEKYDSKDSPDDNMMFVRFQENSQEFDDKNLNENERVLTISFIVEILPFSAKTYFISGSKMTRHCKRYFSEWVKSDLKTPTISLNYKDSPSYIFNSSNGILQSIITTDGETHPVKEEYYKYNDLGGAYLFKPSDDAVLLGDYNKKIDVYYLKGPFLSELVLVTPFGKRIARLDPTYYGLEIEYIVDIRSFKDTDLVVRFSTSINQNEILYSDLNGFQSEKYILRYEMPIQFNYFPMPSMATIMDISNGNRFTIHSDHAAGVGSVSNGAIEVMLDRSISRDDDRGLHQGASDNAPTRLKFVVLFEKPLKVKSESDLNWFAPSPLSYQIADRLNNPLEKFFTTSKQSEFLGFTTDKMCSNSCSNEFSCNYRLIKWDLRENNEDQVWIQKIRSNDNYSSKNVSIIICKDSYQLLPSIANKNELNEIEFGAMKKFQLKN